YLLVPNTVETNLSIYQNVPENSTVEIFSFYGVLYFTGQFTINGPQSMYIDMSYYPTGFYVVRMTSKADVKVYSIVKN
ncbi:MAG: T9SS type A sorting domain-containing protein, partial [Flavobacteriales bacterium]